MTLYLTKLTKKFDCARNMSSQTISFRQTSGLENEEERENITQTVQCKYHHRVLRERRSLQGEHHKAD